MRYRKGRVLRTWAAVLAIAGIAGLVSPGRAGAQQAAGGTSSDFSFFLRGTIDSQGFTDVTLTVKSLGAAPPPSSAKQVVLQAYDLSAVLVLSKTSMVVPFNAGAAIFPNIPNLGRGFILKAQVTLQTPGMIKPQSYPVEGKVVALPSLEIDPNPSVTPQIVGIHHPVSFIATISEKEGDLGATFDVILMSGNDVQDTVFGAHVAPGGVVSAIMNASFHTPGTYFLTVRIQNVSPTPFGPILERTVPGIMVSAVPVQPPSQYNQTYSNTISRTCRFIKDLTLSGVVLTDDGTDSETENFMHRISFNKKASAAAISVRVQTDGVQRLSATIPFQGFKENPTKPLPDGSELHSISYDVPLNFDGSDYLHLDSSWQTLGTVSSNEQSALTLSHLASDYVYFSARVFFDSGKVIPTGHDSTGGPFWEARSSIVSDAWIIVYDDMVPNVFTEGPTFGNHVEQTTISSSTQDQKKSITQGVDPKTQHRIQTTTEFHTTTWSALISGASQ
jgi:hypothetical protein